MVGFDPEEKREKTVRVFRRPGWPYRFIIERSWDTWWAQLTEGESWVDVRAIPHPDYPFPVQLVKRRIDKREAVRALRKGTAERFFPELEVAIRQSLLPKARRWSLVDGEVAVWEDASGARYTVLLDPELFPVSGYMPLAAYRTSEKAAERAGPDDPSTPRRKYIMGWGYNPDLEQLVIRDGVPVYIRKGSNEESSSSWEGRTGKSPNHVDQFVPILEALNQAGVEYLVVGSYALVLHGHQSENFHDLDVVIRLTEENIRKAIDALTALGFRPRLPVPFDQFADPAIRNRWVTQSNLIAFALWNPDMPLVEFDFLPKNRLTSPLLPQEEIPCPETGTSSPSASPDDLIRMKRASGTRRRPATYSRPPRREATERP